MSAVHWFEIPVNEIEAARTFYAAVLGADVPLLDMRESTGSMLGMLPNPAGQAGANGALVQNDQHGYAPSGEGTLVYLNLGDVDLDEAVARVQPAGGQVLLPKTSLGGNGFCAWIYDTEGNKVGLYAQR